LGMASLFQKLRLCAAPDGVRASLAPQYFSNDSRRGLPLGQVSDRPT
jgi:hypothetical protein